MCYTTDVVPKPVAAPTNKLWTIIPNALLRATFVHNLYGCTYIPGIGSKNVFIGTFRTVTIMIRFCRIQPVQMHHPHPRRPMSSRQSAYHHPLMHLTTGEFPIRSEESDEAHHICGDPLELLLRHGYLSVFSIRTSLDVGTWRNCSASYALGVSSISTKHYTSTSVPLLRVSYCLFCAQIWQCCLILSYNTV